MGAVRMLLKVAWQGAAVGPLISLILGWLSGQPQAMEFVRTQPLTWLFYSMIIGLVFATTFYSTCGLPQEYLAPVLKRYPPAQAWILRLLVAAAGGCLGFAIVLTILTRVVGIQIKQSNWSPRFFGITVVLAIAIAIFFKTREDLQRERELRAKTAQLTVLQSQINPHFFFNTLNTLSAVVGSDPDAARAMIQSLAGMFRYTLSAARTETVPLAHELEFVRNYLDLEKARLRDRLQIIWHEEGDLASVRLPALTLQPLIENAIRYGVARRIEPGCLEVRTTANGGGCHILVRNQREPGDGPPKLSDADLYREGHALHNIRERLRVCFGDQASLRVSDCGGDWVEADLHLCARS